MTETERMLAQRVADQERLLVAYRTGGRPPVSAMDRLIRSRPDWESLRQEMLARGELA